MRRNHSLTFAVAGVIALASLGAAVPVRAATGTGDTRVSVASPHAPFSGNKQNEPALAVDAAHPNVLAAGSNDEIDMEACNAGSDTTCPFTPDVGVSGLYLSFDSGHSWTQPTYTGITARGCTGVPGNADPSCTPAAGPIGTLPNYAENGLVSDGDPALAFGPRRGADGTFSWDNGSRLYYANLTSARTGAAPFKGFEAIAVSHSDDLAAAAAGSNSAWSRPVIASKQNAALFADKEQIWADNAASSPHFGNAYVCYAGFRSQSGPAQPLFVLTSRDGGDNWDQKQLTDAADNPNSANGFGRSGCTVRTDSHGTVYVFFAQFAQAASGTPGKGSLQVVTSGDGGATWGRPRFVATAYDTCSYVEASIGRCVVDGVGGARSDLSPAPSVDIANGAPTGADATDQQLLTWVDGRDGLNRERVLVSSAARGGVTWTSPRQVNPTADRGYYSAPALSPDGRNAWLVYNAFTTPFRTSAVGAGNDRQLVGVVLHAPVTGGVVGAFTAVHRGQSGDARGSSQNNLAAEFLGDYVYAVASRTTGSAVWNDTRNAVDCPAEDAYRQALHDQAVASGAQTADPEEPRGEQAMVAHAPKQALLAAPVRPAVQQDCLAGFGDSDIYGGSWPNPS